MLLIPSLIMFLLSLLMQVLRLIAETPNLCKSLHMPAQHGSSSVLTRMHRGYSREAYLALVSRARRIIAGSSSSTAASSSPQPAPLDPLQLLRQFNDSCMHTASDLFSQVP